MRIIVKNIYTRPISTGLGLLQPGQSKSVDVSEDMAKRLSSDLDSLKTKNRITFTVVEDPTTLDSLEYSRKDAVETTQNITIWVDAVNGGDGNVGDQESPIKTLNEAIKRVPPVIKHVITLKVKAGTYTEALGLSNLMKGPNALLHFEGQTWNLATLATGVNSGTFTAAAFTNASNSTATLGSGTWTASDLKHRHVKITSGTLNGRYYPIVDNTTDTIYLAASSSGMSGATFQIVEPAAILTQSTDTNTVIINMPGLPFTSVRFTAMRITSSKTGFPVCIAQTLGGLDIQRCVIGGGTTTTAISLSGGRGEAVDTVIRIDNTTTSANGIGNQIQVFHFINTVVTGGGTGTEAFGGVQISGPGFLFSNNPTASGWLTIQNCGTGIIFNDSNGYFKMNDCWMRGNKVGIAFYGTSSLESDTLVVTNSIADGIKILGPADGVDWGGSSHLGLNGPIITGNGQDGIKMSADGNALYLTGGTISSNARWGINMGDTIHAAHNTVSIQSAPTMSGNTSGDFTLDGTAATSLATLQGDGDKTIVDSLRFNRLVHI